MDVLHFIKTNHDAIRESLAKMAALNGAKARRTALEEVGRAIQIHLSLEKDYLYPEIGGLFAGSEVLVAVGLGNGAAIGKRVKLLLKLVTKPLGEQDGIERRIAELAESVLKHFEQEEQALMPKMRALIRTEDREDLGQVFVDVKAELNASFSEAEEETLVRSRKRA